jgi:hypothetical protein
MYVRGLILPDCSHSTPSPQEGDEQSRRIRSDLRPRRHTDEGPFYRLMNAWPPSAMDEGSGNSVFYSPFRRVHDETSGFAKGGPRTTSALPPRPRCLHEAKKARQHPSGYHTTQNNGAWRSTIQATPTWTSWANRLRTPALSVYEWTCRKRQQADPLVAELGIRGSPFPRVIAWTPEEARNRYPELGASSSGATAASTHPRQPQRPQLLPRPNIVLE